MKTEVDLFWLCIFATFFAILCSSIGSILTQFRADRVLAIDKNEASYHPYTGEYMEGSPYCHRTCLERSQ